MKIDVTDLVALLELMMPTVEVNVEHHNGPRCQSSHQEPVNTVIMMTDFIYDFQAGKQSHGIRYCAVTPRSDGRCIVTLHYTTFTTYNPYLQKFFTEFLWIHYHHLLGVSTDK